MQIGRDSMNGVFVPATPYARLLSRERGVDLALVSKSGMHGEVKAKDVLALAGATRSSSLATPLARRMAEHYGMDVTQLTGSGFGGKIRKQDVLAARETTSERVGDSSHARKKLSGMRRVVAERMSKSHKEIPPVTHITRMDVTALMESRSRLNSSGGSKYSLNDFILKAVAKALTMHPEILVSIDGDEVISHDRVNLGMAVALESGLVVPVIKDADKMRLAEVSEKSRDLAERARSGKLSPDEYRGNTFTVTNLGMFDVESFTPIINQPDAAILGVCSVYDELALINGAVTVRKIMRTCLTYDHRLVDGATAARFQQSIKRLVENPIEIVM